MASLSMSQSRQSNDSRESDYTDTEMSSTGRDLEVFENQKPTIIAVGIFLQNFVPYSGSPFLQLWLQKNLLVICESPSYLIER